MAHNIVEEQGEGNDEANLAVQKRTHAIFQIEIAPKCRFWSAKCYKCSKVGHLASVCHSKVVESSVKSKQQSEGNVHNLLQSKACDNDDE